jgi:hypothetical protein
VDGSSEDTNRRPHRTWAEAKQLVVEFERGGTTREEFCRRHGISFWSFSRYRGRWLREQQAATGAAEWVAVELHQGKGGAAAPPAAGSGLALLLRSGLRIEVGRDFDARTLTALVKVLEPR